MLLAKNALAKVKGLRPLLPAIRLNCVASNATGGCIRVGIGILNSLEKIEISISP